MPTIETTDDHRERIESLREELAAAHAGEYASVNTEDTLAYLLDLADAVDDPERAASPDALAGEPADATADPPSRDDGTAFDRDRARDRLETRNRKHGDPDAADEMDLYSIAAVFDVTGRSDMTKSELIEAVLDAAATLAADPFSGVDLDLGGGGPNDEATADDDVGEDDANDEGAESQDDDAESQDEGTSQLNAMMSLLDTHGDKWREADGDARYEVDLPDGDVETARTKDDVRALLFKNY